MAACPGDSPSSILPDGMDQVFGNHFFGDLLQSKTSSLFLRITPAHFLNLIIDIYKYERSYK